MLTTVLSLICNAVMFVLTACCLVFFFTRGGDGNMKVNRFSCFIFFTVDSNVLAALTAGVMLVYNIMSLSSGAAVMPEWVLTLKFIGATATSLTFWVVILLLGPAYGYKRMYEGTSLIMHLITPVLAMISVILLDGGGKIGGLAVVLSLIPSVLYGAVYFFQVVIKTKDRGGWDDFYGFNRKGLWYLTAPAIIAMTGAIAILIRLLHNLVF